MVIAVSHGGDLLPENRQIGVVESARKDLLTPGGLRTLSPRDSHYRGIYDTYLPMNEKDLAYHQGTAWPWLIGPYCDALASIRLYQGESTASIRHEMTRNIGPLVRFCVESPYKSLPEVFSGDPPYARCAKAPLPKRGVLQRFFEYLINTTSWKKNTVK